MKLQGVAPEICATSRG